MFPKTAWPLSLPEMSFAESLISDLGPLGYSLEREGDTLVFSQRFPASTDEHRGFYKTAHAKVHANLRKPDIGWIQDFEKKYSDIFIDGATLDLNKITPLLRSVNLRAKDVSPRDRAIVDYVRAYQTVGSRKSVGKEHVYILEDVGQHPLNPVMGVLVLASPRYYQMRRDEALEWLTPKHLRSLSKPQARTRERDQAFWLGPNDACLNLLLSSSI